MMKLPFWGIVALTIHLLCVNAGAQEIAGKQIVATIAVSPSINLPITKSIPVLIQAEGLDGAETPTKVYLESDRGTFDNTNKSFIIIPLVNGYGKVVLNLWKKPEDGGDEYGVSRLNLYLTEDKSVPLKSVLVTANQQELIRLISVEGASEKPGSANEIGKWITSVEQKQPIVVRFRVEDGDGKGIAGVPYLLRKVSTFTEDANSPEFSSGVTNEQGEIVVPFAAYSKEGTVIYQVVSEYLASIQAVIEVKK